MRIENTKADGAAAVSMQTGGNSWDMEATTGKFAIKNNAKARFTVTSDGKIGIGEGATDPAYGLVINSGIAGEDPRNDLSIQKGHLYLSGSIKQIGNPKYTFSMEQGGLIKQLNVEGNLGIGLGGKKPTFALQLGVGQTMSIGDQLFMSGANGNSYVSANAYMVDGKMNLHKTSTGASALTLENTGKIKISGTKAKAAVLTDMFTIDAKDQTATFPMPGMKAGFGTSQPQYPIQVNGFTPIGQTMASLAFGMAETSMGYLGSNEKYVYMCTNTGKEVLALDHNTGYVGIGIAEPKSTLHLASEEGPTMSFGSVTAPATNAYIKADPAGTALNMVFGVKNPTNSGGKLTFDFQNEMKFGGTGPTLFTRGDTIFKTGNVGIGGSAFDKKFKLHVKGDMKVDGKVWVATKRPSTPAPAPAAAPAADAAATPAAAPAAGGEEDFMKELDFADLLEEDEGRTQNLGEHGIDLHETLHGLSRVLRKQHRQMDAHDARIGELSQQMSALLAQR